MITLLTGDNDFELRRSLDDIEATFDGIAEKVDGTDITLMQLPDLLQGGTLFSNKRLIILRNLSENKQLWEVLPEWLSRVSDDVHLVLVEAKPDKRTKTYKDLKKLSDVHEFEAWGDRDVPVAERWVYEEAKRQNISLEKSDVQYLVAHVGLDQWGLYHALEKLAVLDEVNTEVIESVIEGNPAENVFNLLDASMRGDTKKVHSMVQTLQRTQDPYMTFGLMAGQVFQLAALAVSDKRPAEIASDIGAHPYALSKLAPHAKRLGKNGTRKITAIFADADSVMKTTSIEPWLLMEEALIKTASL